MAAPLSSKVGAPAASSKVKPKARVNATQQLARVRRWHAPTPNKLAPVDEEGRPMLAIYSLNTNERIEMAAAGERGGFSARDLDRAAHVLREPASGCEHPMDPRLLDLAYRIQSFFRAQEIRVVSAYRAPRRHRRSNHGLGRAIDMIVPGATDEEVAKFARELGFVGIGVYPSSGFVHVDVRQRSYFWVDRSGPGRRNRERGILGDLAARSDSQAVTRGERPTPPFNPLGDVDAWLRARAPHAPSQMPPDEDDEDDTPDTVDNTGY
ncbi:YcbK family protein [Pendulispora albinea]|uniref:Murein endopeptidase K n=1 Tax=Pendulispora albinea TaxID=2741071 RepID=A0ABZ2M8M9_9BACT